MFLYYDDYVYALFLTWLLVTSRNNIEITLMPRNLSVMWYKSEQGIVERMWLYLQWNSSIHSYDWVDDLFREYVGIPSWLDGWICRVPMKLKRGEAGRLVETCSFRMITLRIPHEHDDIHVYDGKAHHVVCECMAGKVFGTINHPHCHGSTAQLDMFNKYVSSIWFIRY